MPSRIHTLAALALAIAIVALPNAAARAQSSQVDPKLTFSIASCPKRGLSEDDRETAAKFLVENADRLERAPAEIVALFAATGQYTDAIAPYAAPLPRRLSKLLSPPADGTARIVFDRVIYVINVSDGRVIDRVAARDEER